MVQTYTSWAAGDIDQRMAGGGENGREGTWTSFVFISLLDPPLHLLWILLLFVH
jgi:hypothetical protein